jgi:hypothetical protein
MNFKSHSLRPSKIPVGDQHARIGYQNARNNEVSRCGSRRMAEKQVPPEEQKNVVVVLEDDASALSP